MSHEEKLQKIKALRKEQERIVSRVERIRRYPSPQSTRIAIKRAFSVIECLEQFDAISRQIACIAAAPVPKFKKGGIFNRGLAIIGHCSESAFVLSRLSK